VASAANGSLGKGFNSEILKLYTSLFGAISRFDTSRVANSFMVTVEAIE
jgi:hypothetical protein